MSKALAKFLQRCAATAGSIALVVGIALPLGAGAAEPVHTGTVARGAEIAQQICSACHVVASDQNFPPLLRQPAPPFEQIAQRPDVTEKSLRHFITTTHWDEKTLPMTMPNPELTDEQTVAVARYILSLRHQ